MNCHQCAGYGLERNEEGRYVACSYCNGVGTAPRDPWVRPVLIAVVLIALYFAWQFVR